MPKDHPAAPTLKTLREKRAVVISLAERYGAYNLRVFGSVARGEATPDSDIDLMANFRPHSLIQRIRLMQELSDVLGFQVDLVQEKSLRPHVKPQALKEAIPL